MIVLYHYPYIFVCWFLLKSLQVITGVDYDCPASVDARIPPTWWLEHNSCKYMLVCIVHKDNKDILTHATELPAGYTRAVARVIKLNELAIEREYAWVKESSPTLLSTKSKEQRLMECNPLLRRTAC